MPERLQEFLEYAQAANIERLQAMLENAAEGESRTHLLKLLADEINKEPGRQAGEPSA